MDSRSADSGLDAATKESLVTAIKEGNEGKMREYIQSGGNVNAVLDNDGNTLLHLAIAARNLDLVKLLTTTPGINLKATNLDDQTPTQLALLEKGAVNKKGLAYKEEINLLKAEYSELKKNSADGDALIAAEKNLKEKETLFEVNNDVMGQFTRIYRTLEEAKSPSVAAVAAASSNTNAAQVELNGPLTAEQKKLKTAIDNLNKAGKEIAAVHQRLKSSSTPEETQKTQRALLSMLNTFNNEKSNINQGILKWVESLKKDKNGAYKKSDQEAVKATRQYLNQEIMVKYAYFDPLRETLRTQQAPAVEPREEIQRVKTTASAPSRLQSDPAPTPDVPRTKLGSIPAQPTIKIPSSHPQRMPTAAPPPPPNVEPPNPEALRRSKEAGQRKSIEQKQPEAGQRKPADLSTMRDAFNEQFLDSSAGPKKR